MCYSLQVSTHIPVFSQGAQNSRGVRKHSTAGYTVSTSCFFFLTQWFKVLRRLDSAHTWVPTSEIFILGTSCLFPPCHFPWPYCRLQSEFGQGILQCSPVHDTSAFVPASRNTRTQAHAPWDLFCLFPTHILHSLLSRGPFSK